MPKAASRATPARRRRGRRPSGSLPPHPCAPSLAAEAERPGPAAPTNEAGKGNPGAGSGERRAVALRDLPEAVRRELPNIVVSGSTYSTNSANRMLMVNGQILHEGDPVAPGVVLRQIKPRAAVLSFREHLYEIAF